ncbi:hypothetical protein [Streptomyces sp. NBC_01190]|jgi:hypothetical protein|uniref:hypothetical protein n=1 Tax=Streptomyces sp. NBC_01190 TaxID=2903767 RepID=UPI00386E050D|nr:hypothetical protein OG519_26885 [Streptomyces sp. NBC_01190]
MTDGLFSDPVHVEPVRAPGERPTMDPFLAPPADAEPDGRPAHPAATVPPRH